MRTPVAAAARIAEVALAVPVGYLTILTGAAWLATATSRRRVPATLTGRYFVVLVPAHDEAGVITDTVAALLASDYPADRFEVRVLADHCTDKTADLARDAGAEVDVRDEGERGKGPTLAWAIGSRNRTGSEVDAFVVVDADTIVSPGFLGALDGALAGGASIVQGQYRVRDPDRSPATGLRAIALALRHHVRPLGRVTLGASSGLFGNGMAFTSAVIGNRAWTNHLTEDIELQMELLLDGVPVAYAADAVIEAEMPATFAAARTQNERWERGRLDLARRYVPQLARRVASTRGRDRVAATDAMLDQLTPPLSVLAIAVGTVSLASGVLAVSGRRAPAWTTLAIPAAFVAHVASGIVLGRLPWSVCRSLLQAPRMVLWKVALWGRILADRRPVEDMTWVRTDHVGATGGPSDRDVAETPR